MDTRFSSIFKSVKRAIAAVKIPERFIQILNASAQQEKKNFTEKATSHPSSSVGG